jgi:RNA polymerase sporulation-specific sigma factor
MKFFGREPILGKNMVLGLSMLTMSVNVMVDRTRMRQNNQNFALTLFLRVEYNENVLVDKSERDLRLLHDDIVGGINLTLQAQPELPECESIDVILDEQVVELAKEGDTTALEYLINKYKNFVRAKARSYFLIGADREDIIQEGMIGLYKAIRDFRGDKLSSFRAFAELCITRQIITAIKTATRQKHIPLNSYVSLNKPIYDEDSDRTLLDVISGTRITDPEELIISREEFDDIEEKMGEILSSLEWKVLMSYLEGKSYQEIAVDLRRHVKSIDNALQRVKRKLERYLERRDG